MVYSDWIYKAAGQPKDYFLNTMTLFWKILIWSLLQLWNGRWATHDWDGNEFTDPTTHAFKMKGKYLAGGFWALLWCLRGDLDHYAKALWMPAHNGRECCSFCFAQMFVGALIPWTAFNAAAEWRPTTHTFTNFLLRFPGRHIIFTLPGAPPPNHLERECGKHLYIHISLSIYIYTYSGREEVYPEPTMCCSLFEVSIKLQIYIYIYIYIYIHSLKFQADSHICVSHFSGSFKQTAKLCVAL